MIRPEFPVSQRQRDAVRRSPVGTAVYVQLYDTPDGGHYAIGELGMRLDDDRWDVFVGDDEQPTQVHESRLIRVRP